MKAVIISTAGCQHAFRVPGETIDVEPKMTILKRRHCTLLTAWLLAPESVFATSTGLNNIPTADTPPDRTIVFQGFTNLGDERRPEYIAGFKMGLRPWGQR